MLENFKLWVRVHCVNCDAPGFYIPIDDRLPQRPELCSNCLHKRVNDVCWVCGTTCKHEVKDALEEQTGLVAVTRLEDKLLPDEMFNNGNGNANTNSQTIQIIHPESEPKLDLRRRSSFVMPPEEQDTVRRIMEQISKEQDEIKEPEPKPKPKPDRISSYVLNAEQQETVRRWSKQIDKDFKDEIKEPEPKLSRTTSQSRPEKYKILTHMYRKAGYDVEQAIHYMAIIRHRNWKYKNTNPTPNNPLVIPSDFLAIYKSAKLHPSTQYEILTKKEA